MKPEPIEEFPPVPTQLLWMFDGIDRKEATKMMHDYAASAITWKPSKALLRAWEDVQAATDKARRLEDELKNRDKCSFMGPMRDCPTHGESRDAARYRWLKRQPWVKTKGIHAWGALLDDAIDEARHDAPDETPNATVQAAGEGFISPVAPATTG